MATRSFLRYYRPLSHQKSFRLFIHSSLQRDISLSTKSINNSSHNSSIHYASFCLNRAILTLRVEWPGVKHCPLLCPRAFGEKRDWPSVTGASQCWNIYPLFIRKMKRAAFVSGFWRRLKSESLVWETEKVVRVGKEHLFACMTCSLGNRHDPFSFDPEHRTLSFVLTGDFVE